MAAPHQAPTPYAIAPDYQGKFKPSAAKEILAAVLNEKLSGKDFSADLTTQWTKEIADEVKTRLKGAAARTRAHGGGGRGRGARGRGRGGTHPNWAARGATPGRRPWALTARFVQSSTSSATSS